MDLTHLLKEQFKDLLTEESLKTIQEAFNSAVTKKTEEQTELALKAIDEDHSTKLKQLVESIDEDHTQKMKNLVEAIDKDHALKLDKIVEAIDRKATAKIKQLAEVYKKKFLKIQESNKASAEEFKKQLQEQLSNYLELYIDELIPKNQIQEAVQNIQARKQLDKIRGIVGISEEFVDGEIKSALKDGAQTIKSLKEQVQTLQSERTLLAEKVTKMETAQLLNEKTGNMPKAKKAFVEKLFEGKTPEYVKENFQYAVQLFEKQLDESTEKEAKKVKRVRLTEAVDRKVVEEDLNNERSGNTEDGEVFGYLNEMKRLDRIGR